MPRVSKNRKYDKGEKVMAKWPSTNLYFTGTILDYNDAEYLIRFDDEDASEYPLKFNQVTTTRTFSRSSRSRSRGRSPAKKSPSRKSPARKSPARKSQGRPKTPDNQRKKSPGRKSASSAASSEEEKSPVKNARAETRLSRPRREVKQVDRYDSSPDHAKFLAIANDVTKRRSTTTITQEKTTIVDGKTNNIQVDVKAVTSAVESKSKVKENLYRAFKGSIISLESLARIAFVLALPLILTQICTKSNCTVKEWPTLPTKLRHYFSLEGFAIAGGLLLAELVLFLIPLGKTYQTTQGLLRCNGIFAILAGLGAAYPLFSYYKLTTHVFTLHYRQTLIALMLFAFVVSLLLYLKSFFAKEDNINPVGNSGYYIHDFFRGREINPSIKGLDIKLFLFRCGIHFLMLISFVYTAKELQDNPEKYSLSLLLTALIFFLYSVDALWFEDFSLSTFEYKNTGLGLSTCANFLSIPYVSAIYLRFHLGHRQELPIYCLAGVVLITLIGFILYRGSNSLKATFRANPGNPALATLETIPTSAGTRLIVSSWWGFVRHPNYLGDLLIQLSCTLLCGFRYAFPWILFGISILYNLLRIVDIEQCSKRKYGLAWGSYCARVKYRLIPRVF